MKADRRSILMIGLALLLALPLFAPEGFRLAAERRRDPLNQEEVNQLRDAMLDPAERLKLYVKFTRDRMVKLEQMRSDPKTQERALKTHDMLEDFLALYGELDDNVEMYVGRKEDLRKPLKLVIEADTEFQSKLRALKNSVSANGEETSQYEFVLTDAVDTVDSSADDHRKTLVEVEEYMKHKKKK